MMSLTSKHTRPKCQTLLLLWALHHTNCNKPISRIIWRWVIFCCCCVYGIERMEDVWSVSVFFLLFSVLQWLLFGLNFVEYSDHRTLWAIYIPLVIAILSNHGKTLQELDLNAMFAMQFMMLHDICWIYGNWNLAILILNKFLFF